MLQKCDASTVTHAVLFLFPLKPVQVVPEVVPVTFPFPLREAFPMVLVANKVDLVHLRKVTTDQGQEMAAKHNVSSKLFFKHLFLTYW